MIRGVIDRLPIGATGLDYSFARPDPAAVKAKAEFVSRYLADTSVPAVRGKVLTIPELDALAAVDLGVMLNWEQSAGDSLKGRALGQRHGAIAEQMADDLEAPAGVHIVVSTDVNIAVSQWAALDAYHEGFAAETRRPLGVYVESDYMDHVAKLGLASLFWYPAAASWSNGRVSLLTHVRQLVSSPLPGTDGNVLLRETPFWFPGRVPPLDPEEDMLTDADKTWIRDTVFNVVLGLWREQEIHNYLVMHTDADLDQIAAAVVAALPAASGDCATTEDVKNLLRDVTLTIDFQTP